jgi:hypothetical protein
MPPSMGRSGAGACTTVSPQARQPPAFAGAGYAGTADHLHPQLRGHAIQHFRAGLVDQVQRTAAAGALLSVDVDHHLVARQVPGQRTEIAQRAGGATLPALFV